MKYLKKKNEGFTLGELIMVLVILAVFSSGFTINFVGLKSMFKSYFSSEISATENFASTSIIVAFATFFSTFPNVSPG